MKVKFDKQKVLDADDLEQGLLVIHEDEDLVVICKNRDNLTWGIFCPRDGYYEGLCQDLEALNEEFGPFTLLTGTAELSNE